MADLQQRGYLPRYRDATRLNHWLIALTFFAAALSGLALFHPSMFFFTNFFGGGVWSRILHPFIGVVMFASFLVIFFKLARDNLFTSDDRRWLASSGAMLSGKKELMPPADKYNAAQKIVFWAMTVSLLVLLVTGLMFWRPYFDGVFSIPVMRIAVLLHSIAAVVLILTVITHIYAAIWVQGTLRAMTRGNVSAGWAKANHTLWYRRLIGQRPPAERR